MLDSPVISVIIPCYNQAHFLSESIGSVQSQNFSDWEAIIVDDGSPDNTREIALQLASDDNRIRYLSKTNGGLSSARNYGFRHAKGIFIQFLDADDLLLPHKFSLQLEAAQKLPSSAITYTDYWLGKELNPMSKIASRKADMRFIHTRTIMDFATRWEHGLTIPIHSPLFPRTLLQRLEGPFDPDLRNHEDWDLWMRISKITMVWKFIEEELAVYRICENSMARDSEAMWSGFSKAIRKHQALNKDDIDIHAALSRLSYANDYLHKKRFAGVVRSLNDVNLSRWIIKNMNKSLKRTIKTFFIKNT